MRGRRRALRRARTPEAKEGRAKEVLGAAARLLARAEYEGVTMAAVAQAAGLAKGTAFRYFETKEALFLALLLRELQAWGEDLAARLRRLGVRRAAEGLPRALAAALLARPMLVRLLSRLHTTLERNVSVPQALAFKQRLLEILSPLAARVEELLPALTPGDGVRFLLRVHALVVGLAQMAAPTPAVEEAMRRDERLGRMRVDLSEELAESLAALLRGWSAGSGR